MNAPPTTDPEDPTSGPTTEEQGMADSPVEQVRRGSATRSASGEGGEGVENFSPMIEVLSRLLGVQDLLAQALERSLELSESQRTRDLIDARLADRRRARTQLADYLADATGEPPAEGLRMNGAGFTEPDHPETLRFLQYARFPHLEEAAKELEELLDSAMSEDAEGAAELLAAVETTQQRLQESYAGLTTQANETQARELLQSVLDLERSLVRRKAWDEQAAETL